MTPEAVIFDIGNVLIHWQPERFYDRVMGEARRRAMFAAVDLHAMNDRVDSGEDFHSVVYETAAAHPEFRDEIRLWHDKWDELAAPDIPQSGHLLRRLKDKDVAVFALSNIGADTFAIAARAYPVLRLFDRTYLSGPMRVIKPNPRIYQMVEEDCGIAPERLLFTDDRADNIAAAQLRGWQTHLFDGPEGWRARLVSAGLLTAQEAAPS